MIVRTARSHDSKEDFIVASWKAYPNGVRYKDLLGCDVGIECYRDGCYFWYRQGRKKVMDRTRYQDERQALGAAFDHITQMKGK